MSYDGLEVLEQFHRQHELGYPLLQDIDARHVKAYGVMNPRYQPGDRGYGVPLPGVLLIAPDGRILGKFAVPDYKERPALEDILSEVSRLVARPTDDG